MKLFALYFSIFTSHYDLIVIVANSTVHELTIDNAYQEFVRETILLEDATYAVFEFRNTILQMYKTARFASNNFPYVFTVGNESYSTHLYNRPLSVNYQHGIFLRAYVDHKLTVRIRL